MAQVSAQKCSLCDEQNGAYYCYECQQSLCTICCKKHGKIPSLRGHTVADINTIDLSTVNKKSQCTEHEKEFLFYCVQCDAFICSLCVTSTHFTHRFSQITEIVVKEREKAKENIEELKLKIDEIASLQEKIKTHHYEQLHVKSKQCIEHIESVSKDLQAFIESKKIIKATEVQDNEQNEQENLKAFLDSTDSVHKQYLQILSELENVLLEKHDVTFYSSYKSIDSDIQILVNIPEEPNEAQIPYFEDKFLYQEVLEYMESKIGNSLCPNCSVQKIKIEDLQSENKQCQETLRRALETKDKELIRLSEDIRVLKQEKQTMQSQYKVSVYQKDAENKKLSEIVENLKKKSDRLLQSTKRTESPVSCDKCEDILHSDRELSMHKMWNCIYR
ncbi:uncharacterized protein LOC143079805 [Mytilus galloprovincialis]|uniref:uncharacterized protein LOC143079805 n=1 Tax=Mytilus galloprovincialis TaxID=29158 RepID=UPI003F7C9294